MPLKPFNSVEGYSVGPNANINVVDASGNVTAQAFTANISANLGSVGNVTITGGTNGQFLRTNGTGGLSFASAVTSAAGSNTQVQFNNNGAFGASANLSFASESLLVGTTESGLTGRIKVSPTLRISDANPETNALLATITATTATVETRYATPLVFGTNASERMRIDASGNVGIGTASPTAKTDIFVQRTSSTNAIALALSDNVTGAQTNGVYKSIRSLSNGGSSISEIRFLETDGTNNNTGIAFATQNTAGNLTEKVRINPEGRVGIGTAAPTSILDVRSSANNIVQIENAAHNTLTGLSAAIAFSRGNDGTADLAAVLGWNNGGLALSGREGLAFATGGTIGYSSTVEAMRITNTGNVGIGITAPTANLHVVGTANITGAVTLGNTLTVIGNIIAGNIIATSLVNGNSNVVVNQNSNINMATNGAERLRITQFGAVGIGTSNPSSKVEIIGNPNSFTDSAIFEYGDSNRSGVVFGYDVSQNWSWIYSRSVGIGSRPFNFNNGTFYIGAVNGNIGIGTTSPSAKLDVANAAAVNFSNTSGTLDFNLTANSTATIRLITTGTGYGDWRMQTGNTATGLSGALRFFDVQNNAERMRINSNGNVGIGTSTPNYRLEVSSANAGLRVTTTSATSGVPSIDLIDGSVDTILTSSAAESAGIIGTFSNHPFALRTNNAERMRIGATGEIGFGIAPSTVYSLASPASFTSGFKGASLGSVSLGASATNYPLVGYNIRFTGTSETYQYNNTDFSSAIAFRLGRLDFLRAASGNAGSNITFTTSMTLDTSGQLGLGIAPYDQGTFRMMQFGAYAAIGQQLGGTSHTVLGWNVRGSSTENQYLYGVTGDRAALYLIQSDGSHRWSTAPIGTSGNVISFTEVMRVNNQGNVGIGISLPTANLHVIGTANITGAVVLGNTLTVAGNITAGNLLASSLVNGNSNIIVNANGNITMATSGSEKLRILTGGNIGIGTTAPRQKLDVDGSIVTTWGDYGIGTQFNDGTQYFLGLRSVTANRELQVISQSAGSPNGNGITFYTGNIASERMRVDFQGNVGIGTTAPKGKLHVVSGSAVSGNTPTYNTATPVFESSATANSGLEFNTDRTSTTTVSFNDQDAAGIGYVQYSHAADALILNSANNIRLLTGTNERVRVDASGNVGIGTSNPNGILHTVGDTAIFQGSGGSQLTVVNGSGIRSTSDLFLDTVTSTGGNIIVRPRTSTVVAITTSGLVGIGTSSPSSTLNVVGTANITGAVTLGSTLNATGNANVGNIGASNGVFTNVSGNGAALSSITGANVTGTVASATTAGTVTTAAQPNITSVGTLTSLAVTGNTTSANFIGNHFGNGSALSSITGANVTGTVASATTAGTVTTAAQPNITSVGTLTSLAVTSNISGGNLVITGSGNVVGNFLVNGNTLVVDSTNNRVGVGISAPTSNLHVIGTSNITGAATFGNTLTVTGNANVGNIGASNGVFTNVSGNGAALSSITGANVTGTVVSATTAGTVTTAAQPNITSVGTLTTLSVSGNISSGNLSTTGILNVSGTTQSSISSNLTMNNRNIVNLAEPFNPQDAATKNYVDTVVQGLHVHDSCYVATTGTLAAATGGTTTYNNGSSGVGATIVTTGTYTTIDGLSIATANTRILVKNETNAAWNGIYTYTNTTALTRATDFDSNVEAQGGDFVFVTSGNVNADTGWVQTTDNPIIGTSNIVWTQFSGAGTYTAGTGLTLTGTQFSVNASQTQITAVGTLGSLSVSGNANVGNIGATNGVFTSVSGNGAALTSITGANVTGTVASATTAGTVTTAAQPNITSLGTLTALTVSGNAFLSTTSGNVGIGTTTPTTRLDIVTTVNNGIRLFQTGQSTAWQFYTSGNNLNIQEEGAGSRIWLQQGGNVGIGTTSPGNWKLNVVQTGASAGRFFSSGSTTTISLANDINLNEIRSTSGRFGIFHNVSGTMTEALSVTTDGNVGIGTATPGARLEVNGNINLTQVNARLGYLAQSDTGNVGGIIVPNYGLGWGAFSGLPGLGVGMFGYYGLVFGTNGAEQMRITNTGNVGIGTTTPGYKLHVSGSAPSIFLEHTGGADVEIHTNDGSGLPGIRSIPQSTAFSIQDSGNIVLSRTLGNVGIGTTTPQTRLDVNGDITANAILSPAFPRTSYSTGTAIFDTITTAGPGLYNIYIRTNPNSGGSANYRDFIYGKVIIGTGWSGSALTDYINFVQESPPPRTMYQSGAGNLSTDVVFLVGGNQFTEIAANTTYTIRVVISGYGNDPGSTVANSSVRLTRVA